MLISLGVVLEDFAVVVLALVIGGAGVVLEIVLGRAAVRPALPDSPQHVGGCASGEDPALPRAERLAGASGRRVAILGRTHEAVSQGILHGLMNRSWLRAAGERR